MSLDDVEKVRMAAGLEKVDLDSPLYTDSDVTAHVLLGEAASLFSWDEAVAFTRVVGSSMSRITDAANYMFIETVERPHMRAGGTQAGLDDLAARTREMADRLADVMRMMLRLHLELSIDRYRRSWRDDVEGDLPPMAVGFFDLVGFTSRSLSLSGHDLAELVGRFESVATETIASQRGRLVKMIGDEVMFVAATAEEGCAIASALLERFSAEVALAPRGGLAYGPVLPRVGDFFGPVVNLAARLVDEAIPGEVLMTVDVAKGASGRLEPAGRRMLKGFEEPVTVMSLALPQS